jgi:hypothetical protein
VPAKTRRPSARRFYEQALSEAERADLPVALEVEGMDEEIAMLRLRLRKALRERPEDLPLMLKGIDALRKMVVTRYKLPREDEHDLEAEAAGVRDEIARLLAERDGDG